MEAGGGGVENRPKRLGGPTLFADDPAEVILVDAQLEVGRLVGCRFPDLDGVGMGNEVSGQELDEG